MIWVEMYQMKYLGGENMNTNLQIYIFQGNKYITDGMKLWVYNGYTIKEVEFKPIIKEVTNK